MRIHLVAHHELDRDAGLAGATLDLGDALAACGHEVSTFGLDDVIGLPGRGASVLFPALVAADLMRRGPTDIVDASCGDLAVFGALRRIRHLGRPRLVTRIHGLEHAFQRELSRELRLTGEPMSARFRVYHQHLRLAIVRRSILEADMTVVLNAADREEVLRLGAAESQVVEMPNGIPEWLVTSELPALAEPLRIVVPARWDLMKGVNYAVEALESLFSALPNASAILLGTGGDPADVIASLPDSVRPRVDVISAYRRDQLHAHVRDCRVALFASLSEGFPVTLLEMMALGVVPIAADNAGSRAALDGFPELLVPPRDPAALAAVAARYLSDRELLDEHRRALRARSEQLTWPRIAEATQELYASLLK